jgi:hypothetical protein
MAVGSREQRLDKGIGVKTLKAVQGLLATSMNGGAS